LHGLAVGNNLIKAYLELGDADEARAVLDKLYAQQRPDWRDALAYWDGQIDKLTIH
jgi:pentatricopeptide repeat protein